MCFFFNSLNQNKYLYIDLKIKNSCTNYILCNSKVAVLFWHCANINLYYNEFVDKL